METNFVPGEPSAAQLVRAVKLLVADFDGRPTSRVTGTGGRPFEFYPTAITDNIPPLHPELSRAVCLLSRYHLKEFAAATVGVGEEDRGAMIISDAGFRSKVVQVQLGDMPAALAEQVSEHFPAGFCRLGSGEPCS